jgi:uncharacterized protein YceK
MRTKIQPILLFCFALSLFEGCATIDLRVDINGARKAGGRGGREPYFCTLADLRPDHELFLINFMLLLSIPFDFVIDTICLPYDLLVEDPYAKLRREEKEKREKVQNSLVGGWVCESSAEKSSFIYLYEGGLWFSVNFPITHSNESEFPEIGLMLGKWNAVMRHEERKEIRIAFYVDRFAYEKKSFSFFMNVQLEEQSSEQKLRIFRIGTKRKVQDTSTGVIGFVDDNYDKNFVYKRL